jgi:hypothetical protein
MKNYPCHFLVIILLFAQQTYAMLDKTTKKHTQTSLLCAIPKDVTDNMLVNRNDPIAVSIKAMLALSITCTHFNEKLEYLGQRLQCYDSKIKEDTLNECLVGMYDLTYWNRRRSVLLLVYAQADHNRCVPHRSLLDKAVDHNDETMVATLFQYGANANLITFMPVFFTAKNTVIAELFVNNKVNLELSTHYYPNVLWYLFQVDSLYENKFLVEFYLDKQVCPSLTQQRTERNLLHCIAQSRATPSEDYLSAVELILTKIPTMINNTDANGRTPLDICNEYFHKEKLAALFKKYNAKPFSELIDEID